MYAYDNAGNITSKAKYAFTTGTLGTATETESFTYSSSTWGDKLLSDGYNTIEYDAIGNPIRIGYYEGGYWYSGYDLTWQGRQLVSYTPFDEVTGDTSGQTSVSYTYNADGIRTSKTVNGVEHRYHLDGTQIVSETWTTGTTEHLIVYIYDENGAPIGLRYRTNSYAADTYDSYFFDKNLQGDIVAIYNASGTKIGSYTYDAWGNCTVITNASTVLDVNILTTYNPFRYRGYYFDVETQWYYLQSRYYNPDWCRFLNADVYISTGQGLLGYNMFAYCRNNPVSRKDRLGTDDIAVSDGEEDNVFDDVYHSSGGASGGGNYANSSSAKSGSANSSSAKGGYAGKHGDLKKNMLKEGAMPGEGYQAHHGLPWAYRDYFHEAGLDVNDANFGRWVKGGGNGGHQSWSYRYGQLWKSYIKFHPIPNSADIVNYFNKLNGIRR